jgi:predicted patatin/cPLA2 family phospholipase
MYQSRLDYEYEQACEEIAKHEKRKQEFIDTVPVHHLTAKEIERFKAEAEETYDNAFHRIIEEAKRIRDDYENKEQRAHERSESTYF